MADLTLPKRSDLRDALDRAQDEWGSWPTEENEDAMDKANNALRKFEEEKRAEEREKLAARLAERREVLAARLAERRAVPQS